MYLDDIVHKTVAKHAIKLDLVILQNILQTSTWTILGQETVVWPINASSNKANQVIVRQIFHLQSSMKSKLWGVDPTVYQIVNFTTLHVTSNSSLFQDVIHMILRFFCHSFICALITRAFVFSRRETNQDNYQSSRWEVRTAYTEAIYDITEAHYCILRWLSL